MRSACSPSSATRTASLRPRARFASAGSRARVAEWQTQGTQNPASPTVAKWSTPTRSQEIRRNIGGDPETPGINRGAEVTPRVTLDTPSHGRHWDRADYVLAGAYTTALVVDVDQTYRALHCGCGLQESNLLGPHPSDGLLFTYNAAVLFGVLKTASVLPSRPWRKVFLGAFTAYELITIHRNARLLASVRF